MQCYPHTAHLLAIDYESVCYEVQKIADGVDDQAITSVWMQFSTTDEMYRAIDIFHNGSYIWELAHSAGRYYSQCQHYYDWRFNTLVFEFC